MFWIQLNHNLCCYHPQTWLSTSFHLNHHLIQVIDASTPKLHHLKVYWAQRLSSSLRISRSSRTPPPLPFVVVAVRCKTTAISEGRSHRRKPASPSWKSLSSLSNFEDPEESPKIVRPRCASCLSYTKIHPRVCIEVAPTLRRPVVFVPSNKQ